MIADSQNSGVSMGLPNFEPVIGQIPSAFLGLHPSGDFAALQVMTTSGIYQQERGGVWDANTGSLLWLPDETPALCWMPNGNEAVLLRSQYQRASNRPSTIVTPLQSEYRYSFERWAWPDRVMVSACPIGFPTGWLDWVAVSPRGTIAAFRWMEQDRSGYEFVAIGADGDVQVEGRGVRFASNLIKGPVFSPDGRYVVTTRGRYAWWNDDEDEEAPSDGGTYQVGEITMHNLDTDTHTTVPVTVGLKNGWIPDDPDSGRWALLGTPLFSTDTAFTVRLPSGEQRSFLTASS